MFNQKKIKIMKKISVKNDVLFNRVVTVNEEKIKTLIVNFFGDWRDYYIEFIKKNYRLEDEEAIQVVDYFFKDCSLKNFFNIIKSLKIEVVDECELTRKKLLDKDFIVKWFSDNQYIGD